jgi:hypothetical protein
MHSIFHIFYILYSNTVDVTIKNSVTISMIIKTVETE